MITMMQIAAIALAALSLALAIKARGKSKKLAKIAHEAAAMSEKHYERLYALTSTPLNAARLTIREMPRCWVVYATIDVGDDGGYVCGIIKNFEFDPEIGEDKEYARRCAEELVEKIMENY